MRHLGRVLACAAFLLASAPATAQLSLQQRFNAATKAMMDGKWPNAVDYLTQLEAALKGRNDAKSLAVVRVRLGEALLKLGRDRDAAKALRSGLEGLPSGDPALQEDRALGLLALAQADLRLGNGSAATRGYRDAERAASAPILRLRAIQGVAESLVGRDTHQALAELDRAIAYFRSSGIRDPGAEGVLRNRRAQLLALVGRRDEAMREADASIEMLPKYLRNSVDRPEDRAVVHLGRVHYPSEALRRREEGDVEVELATGTDGSIARCEVMKPSRSALLNEASCSLLRQRAPLSPRVVEYLRSPRWKNRLLFRWSLSADEPPPEERDEKGRKAIVIWTPGWISDGDYPAEAIRARAQGLVFYKLWTDRRGTPTRCEIVSKSGHEALDRTTCSVLMTRGTFLAALGPDGQPTDDSSEGRINWVLP